MAVRGPWGRASGLPCRQNDGARLARRLMQAYLASPVKTRNFVR
jgi:hypothetical protein